MSTLPNVYINPVKKYKKYKNYPAVAMTKSLSFSDQRRFLCLFSALPLIQFLFEYVVYKDSVVEYRKHGESCSQSQNAQQHRLHTMLRQSPPPRLWNALSSSPKHPLSCALVVGNGLRSFLFRHLRCIYTDNFCVATFLSCLVVNSTATQALNYLFFMQQPVEIAAKKLSV